MLCGLNAGLEALLEAGVECKRIILVGGAAASPAVQQIAGQIFGVPALIPTPGEYVANGAARQAASVALGSEVAWPVAMITEISTSKIELISAQYAIAAIHSAN
jgi:xylulokinase